MRGYSDDIVATSSRAEVRVLRCVYASVCVEFEVSPNGKVLKTFANFLMAEFQRHPSDASMFLAAARAFCLNRRSNRSRGGLGNILRASGDFQFRSPPLVLF